MTYSGQRLKLYITEWSEDIWDIDTLHVVVDDVTVFCHLFVLVWSYRLPHVCWQCMHLKFFVFLNETDNQCVLLQLAEYFMVSSCCGTLDHCTLPEKRQLHLQSNLQSAA